MSTTTRPALSDAQISRMQYRVELFVRRGLARDDAERIADRLVERDADRDDRRMCIECKHLLADKACWRSRQRPWHKPYQGVVTKYADMPATNNPAWPGGSVRDARMLPTMLHRCHLFEWRVPE